MSEQAKREIDAGDPAVDRLYEAVVAYVEDRGGAVLVVGGIEVQQRSRKYNFGINIRLMGRPPELIQNPEEAE